MKSHDGFKPSTTEFSFRVFNTRRTEYEFNYQLGRKRQFGMLMTFSSDAYGIYTRDFLPLGHLPKPSPVASYEAVEKLLVTRYNFHPLCNDLDELDGHFSTLNLESTPMDYLWMLFVLTWCSSGIAWLKRQGHEVPRYLERACIKASKRTPALGRHRKHDGCGDRVHAMYERASRTHARRYTFHLMDLLQSVEFDGKLPFTPAQFGFNPEHFTKPKAKGPSATLDSRDGSYRIGWKRRKGRTPSRERLGTIGHNFWHFLSAFNWDNCREISCEFKRCSRDTTGKSNFRRVKFLGLSSDDHTWERSIEEFRAILDTLHQGRGHTIFQIFDSQRQFSKGSLPERASESGLTALSASGMGGPSEGFSSSHIFASDLPPAPRPVAREKQDSEPRLSLLSTVAQLLGWKGAGCELPKLASATPKSRVSYRRIPSCSNSDLLIYRSSDNACLVLLKRKGQIFAVGESIGRRGGIIVQGKELKPEFSSLPEMRFHLHWDIVGETALDMELWKDLRDAESKAFEALPN